MSRWHKPKLIDSGSLFPLMEKRLPDVPYQSHSRTSRAAAVKVAPKVGSQLHIALAYFKQCGAQGCADFEAIRDLRPAWPTVDNGWRARRGKLVEQGDVVKSNLIRRSPGGLECDVWVLKEFMNAT